MSDEPFDVNETQESYAYSDFTEEQLVIILREILKAEVVDVLFVGNVIKRIANWIGEPGQEEAWMIEADKLLAENFYTFDSENPKESISEEEFARMSIVDRARCFNFLDNYLSGPIRPSQVEAVESSEPDTTATSDLHRMSFEPASNPTNAHFATTDYLDGKAIFGVYCTLCGSREKGLEFFSASNWIDRHNAGDCGATNNPSVN
jgi:hypothetical protein